MPQGVEEESVQADCRDGVLEIRIAKLAVKSLADFRSAEEDAPADHGTIDGNAASS